ncbi:Uncharacterized protein APZ42_033945 [Daphnia magna]|uniref:Uncharacterized protein n=1 Tax=Daphnia magna TaxID=35525 RepID=A0A164KL16_9CRUS|nr:Uncharacterized protein APZ42_033945 [Daphnia magna]
MTVRVFARRNHLSLKHEAKNRPVAHVRNTALLNGSVASRSKTENRPRTNFNPDRPNRKTFLR